MISIENRKKLMFISVISFLLIERLAELWMVILTAGVGRVCIFAWNKEEFSKMNFNALVTFKTSNSVHFFFKMNQKLSGKQGVQKTLFSYLFSFERYG